MPTYEYACDSCGNDFETVQKMSDAPVERCPNCGKPVRRVLSGGIGISFKGAGFYVNDAGSSSKSATSKSSGSKGSCPSGSSCPGCSGT